MNISTQPKPQQGDGAGQDSGASAGSSATEAPQDLDGGDHPPFDLSVTPEKDGEGAFQRIGDVVKRPGIGAGITGAAVLGAAVAFGWLEAAVAAGAAYGAYRLLRRKRPDEDGGVDGGDIQK